MSGYTTRRSKNIYIYIQSCHSSWEDYTKGLGVGGGRGRKMQEIHGIGKDVFGTDIRMMEERRTRRKGYSTSFLFLTVSACRSRVL